MRSDLTLDAVHQVLQVAFEWTDSHLDRFALGGHPFDRSSHVFPCPYDVEAGELDDEGGPGRRRAQPDGARSGSRGCDDDLTESASLTDMCKRGGNLVECEDAIDVDPHFLSNAEDGQRLEVGRPLAHREHPD